jgi:hypothetical protein
MILKVSAFFVFAAAAHASNVSLESDDYPAKVDCPSGYYQLGYPGQHIPGQGHHVGATSMLRCASRCTGNATCGAFEYRQSDKNCYLVNYQDAKVSKQTEKWEGAVTCKAMCGNDAACPHGYVCSNQICQAPEDLNNAVPEFRMMTKENDKAAYWTEHKGMHCSNGRLEGKSYDSLDEAEKACSATEGCGGVYDDACDHTSFFLCKGAGFEISSIGSCIYVSSETPPSTPSPPSSNQKTALASHYSDYYTALAGDCDGNALGTGHPAQSEEDCAKECSKLPKCAGFTFGPASKPNWCTPKFASCTQPVGQCVTGFCFWKKKDEAPSAITNDVGLWTVHKLRHNGTFNMLVGSASLVALLALMSCLAAKLRPPRIRSTYLELPMGAEDTSLADLE